MTNYDKLMRELALMSALKDHVDLGDPSVDVLRKSLNNAWAVVRQRAAAANAYVAKPES